MFRFLLLIIALITYGSLYPFKFSGQHPEITETLSWLLNVSLHTTRSDIIANILLFVPYGFVARFYINSHKKRFQSAVWVVIFGGLLAFTLQYLQFFLPARVPSSGDALFNVFGIIIGLIFSHLLTQYSHNHIPNAQSRQVSWSQVSIPLLLALIWVGWRWFPYMPLVATESILNSLNPLINKPQLDFVSIIRDGIGWLMFFYLISQPPFDKQPRFRVLKIAFYILAIELFIINNEITVNDLLAALGAFALYASMHFSAIEKMLGWGVALGIVLIWLSPFSLADPLHGFNWIPFHSLMKGNPWLNAELILLKIYFVSAMIYLFQRRRIDYGLATILCMALVFPITISQLLIGSSTPDITDTFMVAVIGWAMYQVDKLASDERTLAMNS